MFTSLLTVFLLSIPSHAAAKTMAPLTTDNIKIFRCQSPVNFFDPSFVQGSEIYLDIYYNPKSQKSSIVSRPSEGPAIVLLHPHESTRSVFDLERSHMTLFWSAEGQKTYASLGYLGGPWGLYLSLTSVLQKRDPSLQNKQEVEIFCKETDQFDTTVLRTFSVI